MTVLIADNDRAVSGLLTDVLKQSGLQLLHAYDGDVARSLARDDRVRVLVCDLDMPGASGLEVLESLRDLREPPRSIVISGYLDTAIEARLRAMPYVQEVLRKPFDLLVFAALVRRLVAMGERSCAAGEAAASQTHGGLSLGLPREVPSSAQKEAQNEAQDDALDDRRKDGPGGRGIAVEH